jgi:predicted permease
MMKRPWRPSVIRTVAHVQRGLARIRGFFAGGSPEADAEFVREMEADLALATAELMARGMTEPEARRAARLRLRGWESLREQQRSARGLPLLSSLLTDLRYSLRTLRRDAGFTVFALVTVGLGIGACTTIYSVVNALLLRPLPFASPDRLVWIANRSDNGDSEWQIQVGHLQDLQAQSRSFSDLAAYNPFYSAGDWRLTGTGAPERLTAVPVTTNFFALLGVKPQLGRLFEAGEGHAPYRRPQVVLLSESLWRRSFAADPGIVGRKLILNELPVLVVGVLPRSFDFAAVFTPATRADLFFPMPLTPQTDDFGNTLSIIGRLRPGITAASSLAELDSLAIELTRLHPHRNPLRPLVTPLAEHVSGRLRLALAVLAAAVGVVMLIVCANLSNLLLVRAASRQREMAIRVALGGGRGRLLRQMLVDSFVLSTASAALGLLFAAIATRALASLDAFNLPLLDTVEIDAGGLEFAALLAILTAFIFALVPALHVLAAAALASPIGEQRQRGSSFGRRHTWLRQSLVVAEVAFACILLIGAGLLSRSFLRVMEVRLGYQPAHTVALRIDPSRSYATQAQRNAYYDEALRRVRSMPGIEAAGLTDVLPLGGDRSWHEAAKGEAEVSRSKRRGTEVYVRIVSDGYIPAMHIPLLAGRDLSERDTTSSAPVVVINRTMAQALWPGKDPIGREITQNGDCRVVGVVGDVHHSSLEQSAGAEMYLPIRQTNDYSAVQLVVRSPLSTATIVDAVKRELKPIEPELPANDVHSLQEMVERAVSPRRFIVLLLGGFSLFAMALASLGIYGVISYTVQQRTQELGIRAALGASAGRLQGGVLGETLLLAAGGIGIGAAVASVLARSLRGLLFGVTSSDPLTFAATLLIFTAVAALAGFLPARRAARSDPMRALRSS